MSNQAAKAYWCTPGDWDEGSDLVFAENRNQARSIAMSRGEACQGCEYTEIRAVRNPRADKYADNQSVIHDYGIWREIGGCINIHEERCDTCGLASMGGQWPVCDACNNCIDCGGELEDGLCAECAREHREYPV